MYKWLFGIAILLFILWLLSRRGGEAIEPLPPMEWLPPQQRDPIVTPRRPTVTPIVTLGNDPIGGPDPPPPPAPIIVGPISVHKVLPAMVMISGPTYSKNITQADVLWPCMLPRYTTNAHPSEYLIDLSQTTLPPAPPVLPTLGGLAIQVAHRDAIETRMERALRLMRYNESLCGALDYDDPRRFDEDMI